MASGSTLHGKIAVVTGAAAGIGRATARLFSAEGARVVVADIDAEGARLVADEVSGTAVAVDVADEGEVRSLFEACEAAFGGLDVLVNNAGYVPTRTRAREVEVADWDRVFAINVRGVMLCIKHATPLLKRQGGAIVNLSSRLISRGRSDYIAAKFAKFAITQAAAQELGPFGIRVNALWPAGVDTGMFRASLKVWAKNEGISEAEYARTRMIEPSALGRLVKPEEVAAAALFLASDASSAITGTTLRVNAGRM